jgi:hypothetical protein
MSDYRALVNAGFSIMAAAQIVKDAKAGDPMAKNAIKAAHTLVHS